MKFDVPNIDKSLDKKRGHMPQVDSSGFAKYLNKNGVSVKKKFVFAHKLIPTQNNFNEDKIESMMDDDIDNRSIFISKDFYVLDGHHYFISKYNRNKGCSILCNIADVDIETLIEFAHNYEDVQYKTVNEELHK